jgi:hypothetical protein
MTRQDKVDSSVDAGFLDRHKYQVLVGTYVAVTAVLFLRVHRQPYSSAVKWEQYETIFKGTSLAAVLGGIAMSNTGREKYWRSQGRGSI